MNRNKKKSAALELQQQQLQPKVDSTTTDVITHNVPKVTTSTPATSAVQAATTVPA